MKPSDFPCPICHAQPGERCTNPVTGEPYQRGAHHPRLAAAFPQEGDTRHL